MNRLSKCLLISSKRFHISQSKSSYSVSLVTSARSQEIVRLDVDTAPSNRTKRRTINRPCSSNTFYSILSKSDTWQPVPYRRVYLPVNLLAYLRHGAARNRARRSSRGRRAARPCTATPRRYESPYFKGSIRHLYLTLDSQSPTKEKKLDTTYICHGNLYAFSRPMSVHSSDIKGCILTPS